MGENAAPGLISELKLAVPWGHIAAKAWGSLQGPPVLCLHGWLDNANSFDRLIPLLPQDFYYVAMDFGGHGLSSHYRPGVPYYHQTFVSEIRRVVAGKNPFLLPPIHSPLLLSSQFSCIFPEMVNKLILLDSPLLLLESNEVENLLTYKQRAIEHMLQVEASQEPSRVYSLKQLLQRLLKSNSHLNEECGELLLQRGTTKVTTGKGLHCPRPLYICHCSYRGCQGLALDWAGY
uniref:AB hydrolase-1 domain-containing protein n=1 Tax=Papio anubis TaxID=9555 RepID=A0A096P181_PAPAN